MMINKMQLMASAEIELRKRLAQKREQNELKLKYYRQNPLNWVEDRIGVKKETIKWSLYPGYESHKWDGTPDPLYKILEALSRGDRRIGVESGTGTGKTFLAALITLWFLECWGKSLVVTTAPKQDQLTLHVWKEIGKLYKRFNRGDLTTLKLRMNPGREDWIAVGFVAGINANEESSTKAQGFHATDMLIILEESPGVPVPIINALENTSIAPHNIILALGNPDSQSDSLHKFCMQDGTTYIRISALDHPNVVLKDANLIPGATSSYGLFNLKAKYGENSPMYNSRARGITPKQSVDSLIMMEWAMKCVDISKDDEKVKEMSKGDYALGVDVANSTGGDKAAIAFGKGNVLQYVNDFQCPDANQLGKRDVLDLIKKYKIESHFVGVDGVGVGAGTVNALKEMDLDVINLQSGSAPLPLNEDEQQYNNLRTQMWWQMREDIRNENIILPNDNNLLADLVVPKWRIKERYIVLESKEDIKKRLGRSPNKGDAAVYWNWVRKKRIVNMIEFLKWS